MAESPRSGQRDDPINYPVLHLDLRPPLVQYPCIAIELGVIVACAQAVRPHAYRRLLRQRPQQLRQIPFGKQRLLAPGGAAVHRVGQRGLALLQRQDPLLYRALRHQFVDEDGVRLA